MGEWLLLRSMPRLRLLLRAWMVVLTTGGVLGRGAGLGAHCALHSPGASSQAAMAMHDGPLIQAGLRTAQTKHRLVVHPVGTSSAVESSGHQCPHCPPAECATALPCASGPSTQSAPSAVTAVASLPTGSLRELATAQRATSVLHAPPTPPPQAAA